MGTLTLKHCVQIPPFSYYALFNINLSSKVPGLEKMYELDCFVS